MRTRPAFTLIELLVVVTVIALLTSLLLPALRSARDTATRVACLSVQRHSGLALQTYVLDHDGWYVPDWNNAGNATETVGKITQIGGLGLLRDLDYLPRGSFVNHATAAPQSHPASRCSAIDPNHGGGSGEYRAYSLRRAHAPTMTTDVYQGQSRRLARFDPMATVVTGDGRTTSRGLLACPNYPRPTAFSGNWSSWRNVHRGQGVNATYADGSGKWITSTGTAYHFNGGVVSPANQSNHPKLAGMMGVSFFQRNDPAKPNYWSNMETIANIDRNR